MRKKKIGLLTIGQSPRNDILEGFGEILNRVEVVQYGIFDAIEDPQNSPYAYHGGPHQGEIFVSKLRDGSEIKMDEGKIIPLIKQGVAVLKAQNVSRIAILCTGEYPALQECTDLLRPYSLIHGLVDIVFPTGTIGILVPTEAQIQLKQHEWRLDGRKVLVEAASPYGPADKRREMAKKLEKSGADCIILDCLGFNEVIKLDLTQVVEIPVVLSGNITAWVLREMV